jgi:N-acetylglutamate synthase
LRNQKTCFVSYNHNKLVGVILCGHDGRREFIYLMAVQESVRKMGLGRKLLNNSIVALQCEGITKIGCMVFTDNNLGNRFWDSVGINPRNDIIYRDKIIINAQQVDAPEPATMVSPALQTPQRPAQ